MPIKVRYKDSTEHYIPCQQLQWLLDNEIIVSFRRSTGWVDITKDALRGEGSNNQYNGPDRRGICQ